MFAYEYLFSLLIFFKYLTKNEKRKYNKTYFNNYVISNDFFKKYHENRHQNIKNCIIKWKKTNENEEIYQRKTPINLMNKALEHKMFEKYLDEFNQLF